MHFGDKDFKTHAEIENKIYDIIGVSHKVLTEFIFVEQGQIEGILFNKVAGRVDQKSMQNLCGTQQAELIREYLQTEINSTVPESRSEAIQKTQVKLTDLGATVRECREQLSRARERCLFPDSLEHFKALVARYDAQQAALKATLQANSHIRQYEEELEAEHKLLEQYRRAAVEYADVLASLEPSVKAAYQLKEQHHSSLQSHQARAVATQQLQVLYAVQARPAPIKSHIAADVLEQLQADYNRMMADMQTSYRIANLPAGQLCPTCSQTLSIDHVDHHAALHSKLSQETQAAHDTLTRLTQVGQEDAYAEATYQAQQEAAQRSVTALETLLEKLPRYAPVEEADLKAAEETIAFCERAQLDYQNVSQTIKLSENHTAQLNAGLDRARATSQTMATSLGERVTEDAYREAQTCLSEHERESTVAGEANGRLNSLVRQQQDLEAELLKYQQEELKLGQIRIWRDQVERARGLLHREQLPAVVARIFLEGINRHLARYLEIFEVPFTARLTSEEVLCSFGGKPDVPAGRLSGGQKVMLGLAFRFAIYDQFVSSLGILMLDEPTVYLDDDHVNVAVEMLTRIKSYSRSAGLQLIVVTHDQRLASVFDQTIRV